MDPWLACGEGRVVDDVNASPMWQSAVWEIGEDQGQDWDDRRS